MARLFVYGSLMRGQVSHGRLGGATFVRPARTAAMYMLLDLGRYPALVAGGSSSIQGELYDVTDALMARLDEFEGHPTLYRRRGLALDDGTMAEAYFLEAADRLGASVIPSGDWRQRRQARGGRDGRRAR